MISDWIDDHLLYFFAVSIALLVVSFVMANNHDNKIRDAQFHAALALAQDRRDTLNVVLAFRRADDAYERDVSNAAMAGAAIGMSAGAAAAR